MTLVGLVSQSARAKPDVYSGGSAHFLKTVERLVQEPGGSETSECMVSEVPHWSNGPRMHYRYSCTGTAVVATSILSVIGTVVLLPVNVICTGTCTGTS